VITVVTVVTAHRWRGLNRCALGEPTAPPARWRGGQLGLAGQAAGIALPLRVAADEARNAKGVAEAPP
jgi:hypothetical protein